MTQKKKPNNFISKTDEKMSFWRSQYWIKKLLKNLIYINLVNLWFLASTLSVCVSCLSYRKLYFLNCTNIFYETWSFCFFQCEFKYC